MNHTPGYKTSEFWLTAIVAIPSVLVAAGIIPSGDQAFLGDALSKIAAGVVTAIALCKYIDGRIHLKSYLMEKIGAVLLLMLFLPGLAPAQSIPIQHCTWGRDYSPHLQQLAAEQAKQTMLLQQIAIALSQRQAAPAPQSDPKLDMILQQLQNHQAPQPPQIIVLGGPPQQQIPLGGPPHQDIPLGGPPKQDIPLGQPPRQDIPLGGPPKQDIPFVQPQPAIPPPAPAPQPQPAPKQQIPLGPPPQTTPMPGPTGYQRYTITTLLPESSWVPVRR